MPLPQPFPLPQHFTAPIEAGIRAEDANIVPKYLSSVASSMLCHKRFPTIDEYIHVATLITTKYPWIKAQISTPTVALTICLQNRFKEFRRERKPRSSPAIILEPKIPAKQKSPTKLKSPAKQLMQRPKIAAGEDLGYILDL